MTGDGMGFERDIPRVLKIMPTRGVDEAIAEAIEHKHRWARLGIGPFIRAAATSCRNAVCLPTGWRC